MEKDRPAWSKAKILPATAIKNAGSREASPFKLDDATAPSGSAIRRKKRRRVMKSNEFCTRLFSHRQHHQERAGDPPYNTPTGEEIDRSLWTIPLAPACTSQKGVTLIAPQMKQ